MGTAIFDRNSYTTFRTSLDKIGTAYEKTVPDPADTLAVAASSGGSIDAGVHNYKVSFITRGGESLPSTAVPITISSNQTVNLTAIPIANAYENGVDRVYARKIWRTKAGGTTYYLLHTIYDDTTTTYTDTVADSTLTVTGIPTANTTDSQNAPCRAIILSQAGTWNILNPDGTVTSSVNLDGAGKILPIALSAELWGGTGTVWYLY